MPSPAQPKVVRLTKIYSQGVSPTNKVGQWGEPILYRHDNSVNDLPMHWIRKNHPIGTILIGKHPESGIEFTYVIKERTEDGWWKLEWPD